MSNQVSSQADKVWQMVSAPSTANTYKEALTLTWTILRETGILLWLVLCLGLVAFDWFWTNSIQTGRRARAWFDSIEEPSADRVASEAGRAILAVSKSSLAFTLSQARESLGLPEKPSPAVAESVVEPVQPKATTVESVAYAPQSAKPIEVSVKATTAPVGAATTQDANEV